MEIKLLKKGYQNNEAFYNDFLEDKIRDNEEYFSGESVIIEQAPSFPIYINVRDEERRSQLFMEAFNCVEKYYIHTDRDIHFDELFWHSLYAVYKRDYLLETYPEIKESIRDFNNIVLKPFDWENYIYRIVLATQYVVDNIAEEERAKYYQLIIDNLDLYNYIMKYSIFRNDQFLINILTIIDEHHLTKVMKAKVKDRPDLGPDERIGRRVIFEFNKSYPIIMSPMLSKEELEPLFMEYLSYYYDLSEAVV